MIGTTGENIRRAEILKRRLKFPLPAAELSGVAQHCNHVIDECLSNLHAIMDAPELGDPVYAGIHLRLLRRVVRSLSEIEAFGLPALARFSDDERFVTRLLFRIHQEINYPLAHPIAACFSSGYYQIYSATNVMYVPLSDSEAMLHLPDLYHELGHPVIYHLGDVRVDSFLPSYLRARGLINNHFRQRLSDRQTAGSPIGYLRMEALFRQTWLDNWLDEIVCDLFATYTLGMPYAWAHYHLTAKRGQNAFGFSHHYSTTHPADDARMRAILTGLDLLGLGSEVDQIRRQWEELLAVLNQAQDPDYHLAFPDKLIEAIAVEILEGTRALGCELMTPQNLEKQSNSSVAKLLHQAWNRFWEDPGTYTEWEGQQIDQWKRSVMPL